MVVLFFLFWLKHRIDFCVFVHVHMRCAKSCVGFERCTAMLESGTVVMSVFVPTSGCDVACYEAVGSSGW